MHPEAEDAPGELIHDDHDPVAFQENGLAPEEIHALQARVQMPEDREPGGPGDPGAWPVVLDNDPSDHVFVDVNAEIMGDLLSDPRTP